MKRECGCEGELDFCAHFEGRWLIMHAIVVDGQTSFADGSPLGWLVCRGVGATDMRGFNHGAAESFAVFAIYDEALAAFREAEAELLRVAVS